jgi:hypothetical protein
MDENHSLSSGAAPSRGGTVEPVNRASVARAKFQTPHEQPGTRFELRDPFFDVTYRTRTFDEMTAKADQLGATRFTAFDGDGARTPIRKVNGEWQRGAPLPALPQRSADPMTTRDDVPDVAADPTIGASAARRPQQDKATAKVIARIDAEAERAAMVARIESSLSERYVIKRAPVTIGDMKIGSTEYRFRGDSSRVAFTESTFRLATDTNSPSVARSMVDLAQARDWKGLRVSGAEDFRRMVWLEATVRGVKALGYEPNLTDLEVLKREREARQTNRIEPTREASTGNATTTSEKSSVRGGGRKSMIAAIDAVLVAKKVPEVKRQAILAAAAEQLAQRSRNGIEPKIKVYDRTAQRQLPIAPPPSELNRAQERSAPTRSR